MISCAVRVGPNVHWDSVLSTTSWGGKAISAAVTLMVELTAAGAVATVEAATSSPSDEAAAMVDMLGSGICVSFICDNSINS